MDWMVRLTDGMTYFAMYLSLTLAYSSRFGRVKTACLLLLFTAAGLGSILLEILLFICSALFCGDAYTLP